MSDWINTDRFFRSEYCNRNDLSMGRDSRGMRRNLVFKCVGGETGKPPSFSVSPSPPSGRSSLLSLPPLPRPQGSSVLPYPIETSDIAARTMSFIEPRHTVVLRTKVLYLFIYSSSSHTVVLIFELLNQTRLIQ